MKLADRVHLWFIHFFFEMETGRLFRRLFILVLGYNEMIQID